MGTTDLGFGQSVSRWLEVEDSKMRKLKCNLALLSFKFKEPFKKRSLANRVWKQWRLQQLMPRVLIGWNISWCEHLFFTSITVESSLNQQQTLSDSFFGSFIKLPFVYELHYCFYFWWCIICCICFIWIHVVSRQWNWTPVRQYVPASHVDLSEMKLCILYSSIY